MKTYAVLAIVLTFSTSVFSEVLRFTTWTPPIGVPTSAVGLRVSVSGIEYVTDARGEIDVATVMPHDEVVVFGDDWRLSLETLAEPGRPISVFPAMGHTVSEAAEFRFGIFFNGDSNATLEKIPCGERLSVSVSEIISYSPLARATVAEGIRGMRDADPTVPYVMASETGDGEDHLKEATTRRDIPVAVVVDAMDSFLISCRACLAATYRYHDGPSINEITSVRIVVRNVRYLEELWGLGLIRHELGHARGLRHSSSDEDLMWMYNRMDNEFSRVAFSEREKIAMRVQDDRLAGLAPFDNDRKALVARGAHVGALSEEAGVRRGAAHTGPVTVDP